MRLRARTPDLRYSGEVEFQKATLHVRRNRLSTFDVTLRPGQAEGLLRGSGVVFDHRGIVLSGLVWVRNRGDARDVVELSGFCDLKRLAGRLAYPDPAVAAAGVQPDRWDRSGPAGEVLAAMVDLNAGPGARPERQVAGLVVEDATDVGATVRARRRFPVISEEVERLGLEGGVVVRLRQADASPQLRFTVEPQRDLTRLVVFSEDRGNLSGYDAETEHPTTTVVIVGGPGEGQNRDILERDDVDLVSTFGRWESWVDARNATDQGDSAADIEVALQAEADQHLADHGPQENIAVDTVETATSTWRTHWDVGDLVTVEVDGQRLAKTVEEVEVHVQAGDAPDGGPVVTATPVLGRANPRHRLRMLSRLGELEQAVAAKGKE